MCVCEGVCVYKGCVECVYILGDHVWEIDNPTDVVLPALGVLKRLSTCLRHCVTVSL